MIKKNPKADLRSSHTVLVQFGIICSLLCFIAATHMEIKPSIDKEGLFFPTIKDGPFLIDIPQPIPPKKPAPPKPSVLNVLPDNDPIEPGLIDFDEFDINTSLPIPPIIDDKNEDDEIVEFLPIMPEMKGGISKLYSEIKYPKQAREIHIEGKVIVQYIVNKEGKVENPTIIRGIGGGCDEEVIRAIKRMSFTPGIQNGTFVKVRMSQMVTFKLQK